MREEVGVLIRLAYLVSNPFLRRMLIFPDSRPCTPVATVRTVYRTNKFSCFLGLFGREHMAWKHGNRASSSNTSESQLIQSYLAVIPFKFTIIRSPESPRRFPIS